MSIPTVLDLEQFYEDGEYTELSKKKLMEYADRYYADLAENKASINIVICMLKGRINEKLQEKRNVAFDFIISMVTTEEYKRVQGYDEELLRFVTAVKIYQMERGSGSDTIFNSIQYIDDFLDIYRKLEFYFLRIQMGLSKPVVKECMTYFRAKKLSVFAVAQVLMDSNLGAKEKIASVIADLYQEFGEHKEALFMICMALENARSQYVPMLEEQRSKIMEYL